MFIKVKFHNEKVNTIMVFLSKILPVVSLIGTRVYIYKILTQVVA